jgi:putative DNA primase/helicase
MAINSVTGLFYDHEKGVGGGVLDLIKHKLGFDSDAAKEWLQREGLVPGTPGVAKPAFKVVGSSRDGGARNIEATYDYPDESGALLSQVVRYPAGTEPRFRQRRPSNAPGEWIWNLKNTRRVPYRLTEVITSIAAGKLLFVAEGEKDSDNLCALGFAATTNPGGAGKWRSEYSECLRGADVVVVGDNDEPGRAHVRQVAASLRGTAKRVRVLELAKMWPECPAKGDISDWIAAGGTAEKLMAVIEALPDSSAPKPRLRPVTLAEFFCLEIKPREMVLDPIIPQKGLAMLYASRGTGKTHLALGIAYAVATGTKFLKWAAPKSRRVLLVDGEMPAAALQERLASIVNSTEVEAAPDMLKILAGDLIEEGGVGNVASPEVQAELDPWLEGVELLILDNLSSLTAVIRDNEAESWGPVQEWLLRLRRRGVSVLIVHHAGKGGQQRGTSRREDVLDTSISLRHPSDYTPTEGARFEVHLDKARGVHGDAAKAFEALLEVRDGHAVWTTRDIEDVNLARVQALLDDGLTVREIADETGIPKSTVQRLKKKAKPERGGPNGRD